MLPDRLLWSSWVSWPRHQAAIRAGYSARTPRRIGDENLTKPDLAAFIAAGMVARRQRTTITQDKVLADLEAIKQDAMNLAYAGFVVVKRNDPTLVPWLMIVSAEIQQCGSRHRLLPEDCFQDDGDQYEKGACTNEKNRSRFVCAGVLHSHCCAGVVQRGMTYRFFAQPGRQAGLRKSARPLTFT